MKKVSTRKISIIGIGISLNIIGAFIALNLKLPIYMDSIGTIMVSFLLGPVAGIVTGILGSLVSGITFDIYSIYFAPVQITTGLFAGLLYRKGMLKGFRAPFGVLIITLFTSTASAIIAAFVFGGITSSGSSIIVTILSNLGVNKVVSVFAVQYLTDYADKFLACVAVSAFLARVPYTLREKIVNS